MPRPYPATPRVAHRFKAMPRPNMQSPTPTVPTPAVCGSRGGGPVAFFTGLVYWNQALSSRDSAARKASCGISTVPNCFIRFLPFFCFFKSFFLRVTSPP